MRRTFVSNPTSLIHLKYRARQNHVAKRGGSGEKSGTSDDSDPAGDADPDSPLFEITGTANHPFWSQTHGRFVEMGELQVGDILQLEGGQEAEVVELTQEYAADGESFTTYNFEVDGLSERPFTV